jgi:4-amino-4-deoxy-L-arabinose transferase-like glycosyltransferase
MTATLTPTDVRPDPPEPPPAAPPRSRRERAALAVLLAGTAVLYLWDLGASGWANSFYAAAVQAGTKSWEALLFGSLDPGNIITVDKPPASLWVMALSGRIFGFSPWSMLVPEALMGVATVALVYAAVRRVSGPNAGLIAGAAMALTPVAVLMFRFNNPDALLVLLMVGAAYATVRAIEKAGTRWLLLAGVLIGFAFLTKMLAGFVVLPALALAYLWAAPTDLGRRILQLLGAGVAIVVSAGWWVALTELWPAGSKPYIGGSVGNSVLELALGYNGLGRIFGGSGDPGGNRAGGGFAGGGGMFGGGSPGITRMFGAEVGGQVAWLLPAALVLLVAGLWLTRRAPRVDPVRASLLLWGGWTVVTALVFSYAEGIFHAYYTVALAPGIAALVGVGGAELWKRRATWSGRAALAVVVAGTAGWAWVLLGRSAEFLPWLRWAIVVVALIAVVALLVPAGGRRWAGVSALAVVLAGVAGPAAYAVDTAGTPHTGSISSAGPATGNGRFPGGGGAGRGPGGAPGGGFGAAGFGAGGFPGGEAGRAGARDEAARADRAGGAGRTGGAAARGGPGEESADPALTALLRGAGTKWAAATVGAQSGAALELASDTSVISIGGFMGSDPAPTLEQFQSYVAAGEVRYFVEGGGFGGGGMPDPAQLQDAARDNPQLAQFLERAQQGGGRGGFGDRGTSAAITTWVQQNYSSTTVGGRTVYDLTKPLQN